MLSSHWHASCTPASFGGRYSCHRRPDSLRFVAHPPALSFFCFPRVPFISCIFFSFYSEFFSMCFKIQIDWVLICCVSMISMIRSSLLDLFVKWLNCVFIFILCSWRLNICLLLIDAYGCIIQLIVHFSSVCREKEKDQWLYGRCYLIHLYRENERDQWLSHLNLLGNYLI